MCARVFACIYMCVCVCVCIAYAMSKYISNDSFIKNQSSSLFISCKVTIKTHIIRFYLLLNSTEMKQVHPLYIYMYIYIYIIIIIIISCCSHRFPLLSLAIRLYHLLLSGGLLGYIICLYRAVVDNFKLVVPHLCVSVKGPIVYIYIYIYIYMRLILFSVREVLQC